MDICNRHCRHRHSIASKLMTKLNDGRTSLAGNLQVAMIAIVNTFALLFSIYARV